MSARINRSAVFAAAVFTLVACRGGDATGTRELPGCTGPVSISVTAGTSPRFSWTPACKVYYLHVGGEGTGEQMWSIANFNEQNTISPGVKFGVVPDDTRGIDGPLPLQVGKTYFVFVAYYDNGLEKDGGRATFTP